ncbi:MAG: diguanylate cyclase [Spirochaetota bacterium]
MEKNVGDIFDVMEQIGLNRAVDDLGLFFADIEHSTGHTSKLLRSYGFTDEELRDGSYQERIHPDDRGAYLESWRRMNEGREEELFCEYRVRDGGGVWHWIETHAVVLERRSDGSFNTIVGIDRPIDARRHAVASLEQRYRDARRKLHIAEALSSTQSWLRFDKALDESLNEAADQLAEILSFDRITLFMTRSGSAESRSTKWHRIWTSHAAPTAADNDLASALGRVHNHSRPMIIDLQPGSGFYRSLVVVPIIVDGVTVAAMSIQSGEYDLYRSEDLYPVEAFARIVAIVLGNHHFIERKIAQLKQDSLTGFLGRTAFEHDAPVFYAECCMLYPENALAMIDIDYFKRINDTYGHQMGDAVIRRIADAIRRSVRSEDMIIRYGGEEFLVILPNTGIVAAEQIMNRLRGTCEALHVSECNETITVSIGVASFASSDARTLTEHIARADSALYEAKQSGRNLVKVWSAATRAE